MPLTPKQKKVLDFITRFAEKKGYAPSQQEIASHFGFRSLGTVQNYLVRLEKQGALKKTWNAKRSLEVRGGVKDIAGSPATTSNLNPSITLPLVGQVAAGLPIEAVENREEVEIPESMLLRKGVAYSRFSGKGYAEHFALRVVGNSMIEDGILDGDVVIIRKQSQAENGQTVVALVNEEATIKRFYRKKQKVELHPANPAFQPLVVDSGAEFRIEGVLAGVIRQF